MGKVFFEDPVHHISGKISKAFRTIYNHMKASGVNFTSVRLKERTSEPTPAELAARNKFSAVSKAVNARLKDLNRQAEDQAAFKAQTQYKTLRQYVWSSEAAKWEQENN